MNACLLYNIVRHLCSHCKDQAEVTAAIWFLMATVTNMWFPNCNYHSKRMKTFSCQCEKKYTSLVSKSLKNVLTISGTLFRNDLETMTEIRWWRSNNSTPSKCVTEAYPPHFFWNLRFLAKPMLRMVSSLKVKVATNVCPFFNAVIFVWNPTFIKCMFTKSYIGTPPTTCTLFL